jgi:hypothetical protein
VANGGPFRGEPLLAKILAEFWAGAPSTEVSIAGRTAYREVINGQEWLLWNNDTHLFVLIGPAPASETLMQTFMEQPPPYRWRAGDCLDFRDDVEDARPWAPFGQVGLAHCSAEHTFEVIYSEATTEGPDAPYPDDIVDRSRAVCADAYLAYTGSRDELTSLIGLTNYLPDEDEWARGSRYLACGVYLVGAQGTETVTGRLEGQGPDHPLDMEVGLCLADGYPVGCALPHNSEVIAQLEYPAGPDEPLPAQADLDDTGQAMCTDALDAYGPTPGDAGLVVDAVFHSTLTWSDGERGFYCVAAAIDPGGGPVDVTGTFDGDWSIFLGGGSA